MKPEPALPNGTETLPPSSNGVGASPAALQKLRIRMYCQGFGDCFLLTFTHKEANQPDRETHALIDFGVWREELACPTRAQVAEDIRITTKGVVDILVITHEHRDHLSGFYKKMREDFFVNEKIKFKQLWLAWTEDTKNNPLAQKLHEQFSFAIGNLVKTQTKLRGMSDNQLQQLDLHGMKGVSRELLALELGTEEAELDALLGDGTKVDEELRDLRANEGSFNLSPNKCALAEMKEIVGQANVKYFKPGQLIEHQPLLRKEAQVVPPGVRFYVLGPPEDMAKLQRDSSDAPGDLYLDANLA
ncbi:MAG: hypothetical protein H7Z75_08820, partial [Ferruginibacter sp.]|nr:hypothetical protein [Cytophagales bacterium]